jgi:hypothetical protein
MGRGGEKGVGREIEEGGGKRLKIPKEAIWEAARRGNLETIQWLMGEGIPWSIEGLLAAGEEERWAVLEWWKEKRPERETGKGKKKGEGAKESAGEEEEGSEEEEFGLELGQLFRIAQKGNLKLLKWFEYSGFPITWSDAQGAARGGHVHILQWLKEELGLPEEEEGEALFYQAVKGGSVPTLSWLLLALPFLAAGGGDPECSLAAAKAGHVEVLGWLEASGFNLDKSKILEIGGSGDSDKNFRLLKWAVSRGFPFSSLSLGMDADLEKILWAVENGAPWNFLVCAGLAARGDLAGLRRVRALGCPWDANTTQQAAGAGHVDLLRWAHAEGCPWSSLLYYHVILNLRDTPTCLEILRYARAGGCPLKKTAVRAAIMRGNSEILKWLEAEGCPWIEEDLRVAAEAGRVEVLEWLKGRGRPLAKFLEGGRVYEAAVCKKVLGWNWPDSDEKIPKPVLKKKWHVASAQVLDWLFENGAEISEKDVKGIIRFSEDEFLYWVRGKGVEVNYVKKIQQWRY